MSGYCGAFIHCIPSSQDIRNTESRLTCITFGIVPVFHVSRARIESPSRRSKTGALRSTTITFAFSSEKINDLAAMKFAKGSAYRYDFIIPATYDESITLKLVV